jgi:hypothetical protein
MGNGPRTGTDMAWTHATVYLALVKLHGSNLSPTSPLTCLYEQKPNCAVLYAPHSRDFRSAPVHLHPGRVSWRSDVYKVILPAIESIHLEHKAGAERRFLCCAIRDWNLFASGLGLVPEQA